MNEPRELTEYLAEIDAGLKGKRSYRHEIIEELRSHLLDEIDDQSTGGWAARRVIYRFGAPDAIASGFNELRRVRRLRTTRSLLALAAFSLVGGLAAQRVVIRSETPSTPSTDHVRSAMIGVSGDTNAIAINPATREIVYTSAHA